MSRYRIAPQARDDLKDIFRYVAQDRPSAVARLREAMSKRFRQLASQPLLGQACPELRVGLRAFSVGPYAIFYVPIEGGVEIERVLHGARDIESLF